MKIMKRNRILFSVPTILILLFFLGGCSFEGSLLPSGLGSASDNTENELFKDPEVGTYDSVDTAIVIKIDTEEKSIQFRNVETGKDYTLTYDGTSLFFDKYEDGISPDQLETGDIADVTFLKNKKLLVSYKSSEDFWTYTEVINFSSDKVQDSFTIGNSNFGLYDYYTVTSENQLMELTDINERDILTVRGKDTTVYSVNIDQGHGYVTLSNDEDFYGGFIQFNESLIFEIQENMIYIVPEGDYDVRVILNGSSDAQSMHMERNGELNLDLSAFDIDVTKYGLITFQISPENATLLVDGTEVDYSQALLLEYGIHQLDISKTGYEDSTQYINVAQDSSVVVLELTENSTDGEEEDVEDTSEEAEDDSTDVTDSTDDTSTEETSDDESTDSEEDSSDTEEDDDSLYYVTVTLPSGVEVYLDGNYIGIAPVSFVKESGSHVITLRKTGYQTRSYTISLDSYEKDDSISFSDLELIDQ